MEKKTVDESGKAASDKKGNGRRQRGKQDIQRSGKRKIGGKGIIKLKL